VIADAIWAKLLWAGLNLGEDDFPVTTSGAGADGGPMAGPVCAGSAGWPAG
jgi:hypothetical protein